MPLTLLPAPRIQKATYTSEWALGVEFTEIWDLWKGKGEHVACGLDISYNGSYRKVLSQQKIGHSISFDFIFPNKQQLTTKVDKSRGEQFL